MLVHQILNAKDIGDIFTVPPSTSVAEAVEELSARRIGALIVSEDGSAPLGILSERDIVREIGRRGAGVLSDTVSAMMTSDLVTCAGQDSADDVMKKMTAGRFRHMPVMEGERMIGLISIGDVVKARLSELAMEKDALEGMIKGF
ncbi:MAG: CBS domain-containing protein [Paracoccaceae bacterium]|nr:CBS domain-containing protein [Paracoccaceae bacterium]